MKKLVLLSVGLLASVFAVQAQVFTPGNIAVLRLNGFDSSSGNGAAIIIDEYSPSGSLLHSFSVPTSGANAIGNVGLSYAGLMTLTPDGNHLVFNGYNTSIPSTSQLNFQSSSSAPRAIATLDAYGNFSLPIKSSTAFNGFTIIGSASDGTNYWMSGNGPSGEFQTGIYPQVVYMGTAAAGTAVPVATNIFSSTIRGVNVYDVAGTLQLFVAGTTTNTSYTTTIWDKGTFVLSNISGALPTSGTTSSNYFPQGTGSQATFDITINPAGTIAYVADNDNGIIKYTYNGSSWVSNYTVPMNGAFPVTGFDQAATGVTADWTQTPPVVYATTGETLTNRIVAFQDTGVGSTITNLAVGNVSGSVTNTFRGIRLVPNPYAYVSVSPQPFTGPPGVTATFTATVLGTGPITNQWYSNSVANPTFVAIPGATSTNLSLANITLAQSGSQFYLASTNIYGGSVSATATLTVLNPAITTEPVGATNFPGGPAVNLCVSAVGTPDTLTYQWFSNGISLGVGAQGSCYMAPSSAASNTAVYTVVVSNSVGSITSSPAIVSYTPYLLYDTFTYPNGNLFGDAGSPWILASGSAPVLVTNDNMQINQNASGDDLLESLYSQSVPENSTVLWASFNINVQQLPTTAAGTYFAYFGDTNFDFYGRLMILTSNNPTLTPNMPATAYPGTFRIGMNNKETTGPSAVVELDMATNTTYNVVAYYDMEYQLCQVAVNPSPLNYLQVYSPLGYSSGPNSLVSGYTTDTFTPTNGPMEEYGFRQNAGVGVMNINDLEVSYDWTGYQNGGGYAAVTAGVVTNVPVVGFTSASFTNYSGNSNVLEIAASGIGLSYQWYQNGAPLSDGNSLVGSSTYALTINPGVGSNAGTYFCVASNSVGTNASANIVVGINTTPTAPMFTVEPLSTTSSLGSTVTFTATAVGTGPITYAWYTDGSPNGQTGSSLTLTGLQTNQTGTSYSVVATGGPPNNYSTTSSNAVLTVLGPIVTNIAYLRSLQVTNAAPTITVPAADSSVIYQVSGYVITSTNIESPTYTEYWIEDNTGGIEFFIDSSIANTQFTPKFGDYVTVAGEVNVFDDALEFEGAYNNAQEPYGITSTNTESGPFPFTDELIPFGFATANPGLSSLSYQGKLATFTNCYFETPGGTFTPETTYTVTNNSGQSYAVFVSQSAGPDLTSMTVPVFAYSITAVYDQFDAEYELNLSAGSNVVTAPPPPVNNLTASAASTNTVTLTWPAVAANYTYSVWSTTNLAVPFTPLAPGLWFPTTNGTYTATIPANTPAVFYKIVSP